MQRVRRHQQPLELHPIQWLAQDRKLTGGIGGVDALGNRHAQVFGAETHLGNETRCPSSALIDRPLSD